jgi:hypothetical protein
MKSRRVEYEAATELVCGGCVCLCSGEHVRQSCGSEQCSSCVCVCVCVCVRARQIQTREGVTRSGVGLARTILI